MHNTNLTPQLVFQKLSTGLLKRETQFTPSVCDTAIEKFLSEYQENDQKHNSHLYKVIQPIEVTANQFNLRALDGITGYGPNDLSIMRDNEFLGRTSVGTKNGMAFYVVGDTMYIENGNYNAVYVKDKSQFSTNAVLPMDRRLNRALFDCVVSYFYETEGQMAEAQDYEAKYIEALQLYFQVEPEVIYLD